AAGEADDAQAQISAALATLDNADFPLAAWRIYLAAAEIWESLGDSSKAAEYRGNFETVMRTLAQNFDAEDRLRSCLLAAVEARQGERDRAPVARHLELLRSTLSSASPLSTNKANGIARAKREIATRLTIGKAPAAGGRGVEASRSHLWSSVATRADRIALDC